MIFPWQTPSTEQLIERYYEPLYWHIRRLVVSHEDAEDVLQETFIRIHTHRSELRKAESERAWVYRIATNQALMWLRDQHSFVSLEDEEAQPLIDTLRAETYIDTSDSVLIRFQEALLTLPTMQRTVFNLRYYDELPYEDIAAITGSSVGAAKTNFHLAKEKVMHLLNE